MRIFLIRHADAVDANSELPDEYRYITLKGRKVTREVAKKLKEQLALIDKIFTSPLVRAVQTTEVIASCIRFRKEIEIARELSFSASVAKILQLLHRNQDLQTIALVGHEPTMGILAQSLQRNKEIDFPFKKSGVCCIDMDLETDTGTFQWYLNPKTLELIT